jgi:parallel beta-helix repeat protein
MTNCTISNNSATNYGGGIYCDESSPTITNCTISGNLASNGGGIFCALSSPQITNCTISGNLATSYGGGICCYYYSPRIVNSILYDDSPQEISLTGGFIINITYSNIQGGWKGEGNIDADPLFVGGGDYHLTVNSPCIDVGSNTAAAGIPFDKDGNPRIMDGNNDGIATVDMGAYEYQGVVKPAIFYVSPERGGNVGAVTVKIVGRGFQEGAIPS